MNGWMDEEKVAVIFSYICFSFFFFLLSLFYCSSPLKISCSQFFSGTLGNAFFLNGRQKKRKNNEKIMKK